MRRLISQGFGLAALVLLAVLLFSFADGTRNIQQLRNSIKPTVQPGKPGFFVVRGTPTTCKDFLKPVLQPTDGGLLRGVGFGMPLEQVQQIEQRTEHLRTDFKLVYDHGLEENVKALVTYDFNHSNQLDVVSIDYYASDNITTACILNEYLGYFSARYGMGANDADGYTVWEVENSGYVTYKIFLKDVSVRDDAGVSLQFVAQNPAVN